MTLAHRRSLLTFRRAIQRREAVPDLAKYICGHVSTSDPQLLTTSPKPIIRPRSRLLLYDRFMSASFDALRLSPIASLHHAHLHLVQWLHIVISLASHGACSMTGYYAACTRIVSCLYTSIESGAWPAGSSLTCMSRLWQPAYRGNDGAMRRVNIAMKRLESRRWRLSTRGRKQRRSTRQRYLFDSAEI